MTDTIRTLLHENVTRNNHVIERRERGSLAHGKQKPFKELRSAINHNRKIMES